VVANARGWGMMGDARRAAEGDVSCVARQPRHCKREGVANDGRRAAEGDGCCVWPGGRALLLSLRL
jgi:hypothetical protein